MKLLTVLASLLVPGIALGDVVSAPAPGSELEEGLELAKSAIRRVKRRGVCSPSKACARRVTGTKLPGLPPLTDRQSDCSSFMLATVTDEAITTTVTASTTVVLRRQESAAPSGIPSYAAEFCDASLYSGICSAWGITPATTTVTPPTVTVTETPTATSISGVLQVKDAGGASLGYVTPDPNYWTPMLTPDITAALGITFELLVGATQATSVNFVTSDTRGTYFAPVVGRDSTSDDIAPGSFNYLYLTPTSETTPAGSPPQSVPNFFATSTGLDKKAETAVWSVDIITGAVSAQWINTDGNPAAATILFVQSNHVYASGDPPAFQARFPAPVTAVTLTFLPIV